MELDSEEAGNEEGGPRGKKKGLRRTRIRKKESRSRRGRGIRREEENVRRGIAIVQKRKKPAKLREGGSTLP